MLLEGLKRLEYRGYDSAGMATVGSAIDVRKDAGRIDEIDERLSLGEMRGHLGIAHTRWATHGRVTAANAHPHVSCDRHFAVVHNGIIENYAELRQELKAKGHTFMSETDSEVIAHLIEEYASTGASLLESSAAASRRLEGSFAFLAVSETEPSSLVAARLRAPMTIGLSPHGNFAASDVVAFLPHTKRVVFLEDGDIVEVTPEGFRASSFLTMEPVERPVHTLGWSLDEAAKGGYEHFTLKEILEQPETLEEAIEQERGQIQKAAEMINRAFGAFFVACGSSYHACLAAQYWFAKLAKKHVNVVYASEFPYFSDFLTENTLMVAVSQSGETADVLEAVRAAKKRGVKVLALVNVMGSSLVRLSDLSLMLHVGPEMSVAATKSYTAQLALLGLLAYACVGRLEEGKREMRQLIRKLDQFLHEKSLGRLRDLAASIKDCEHCFLIGRSLSHATALEGALKIKELSYMHAEGFAGGELKHGTLALIEEGVPCIALVPEDETKTDTLANIQEVKARGGRIIGVANEWNPCFDEFIRVPNGTVRLLHPALMIVPIQLLAYYLAVLRGYDPDRPRNLAKSVTVK
ncbi:MAG: glutamine--fructose-6-phosphate transaminase (isomerizing) [Candidatus Bathyarchaeia archaeon]